MMNDKELKKYILAEIKRKEEYEKQAMEDVLKMLSELRDEIVIGCYKLGYGERYHLDITNYHIRYKDKKTPLIMVITSQHERGIFDWISVLNGHLNKWGVKCNGSTFLCKRYGQEERHELDFSYIPEYEKPKMNFIKKLYHKVNIECINLPKSLIIFLAFFIVVFLNIVNMITH